MSIRVTSRLLFRSRPASLALLGLLCVSLVAACSSSDDDESSSPTAVAESTPEPSPPPPPPPAATDPLTGVGGAPTAPLAAIKIDNSPLARPYHRGLEAVSVGYVELVEGGATRLLGLFSQPPDLEVGPIRSFRESDIELLAQYGRSAVAFSGANDGVLAQFGQAVAAGQLADAGYDTHPGLYRIGERRSDAKNFYASPLRIAQTAAGATPARDVGWTFDPAPRPDAAPGTSARVVFSDRETVEVRYDVASQRYGLFWGGSGLTGAAPANVVIQQVPVRGGGDRDVTGAVTPYSQTVGGGKLEVLRDGTWVSGRWERLTVEAGTSLLDAAGARIALKPGPTWVLLQPTGLPLTVR